MRTYKYALLLQLEQPSSIKWKGAPGTLMLSKIKTFFRMTCAVHFLNCPLSIMIPVPFKTKASLLPIEFWELKTPNIPYTYPMNRQLQMNSRLTVHALLAFRYLAAGKRTKGLAILGPENPHTAKDPSWVIRWYLLPAQNRCNRVWQIPK